MIFGGFRADTDRADIEDCLRKIMANVDGVEKIQTFTDNGMMWAFIKADKNVKFKHEGEPRAIWFSIEKTAEERRASGKVSLTVRALVNHLTEVGKLEHDIAKKHIDADYQKGIIVYKELAPVINWKPRWTTSRLPPIDSGS